MRPLALAFLSAALFACERDPGEVNARFRRAASERCPLFYEDFMDGNALPACPFPRDSASARPCAIERYLGQDPVPRVVRRLQYDADGRIARFSDHRGSRTVEARRFVYEVEPQTLTTQVYSLFCNTPTPRYLYEERLRYDELGRLVAIEPEFAAKRRLEYTYVPGWIQDRAQIRISERGRQLTLDLDFFGNIEGSERTGHPPSEVDLTVRNGRLREAQWRALESGALATVRYAYGDGQLREISVETEEGQTQRYRFRYHCRDKPGCRNTPPPAARPDGMERSALSWDPQLRLFEARNCSDQYAHGPRLCGPVPLPHPNLEARCCNTDPAGIQIELRSPLADDDIEALALVLPDGKTLSSIHCRGQRRLSDCRFARDDILALPRTRAAMQIRVAAGMIEKLNVDTGWLIDAAR